LIDEFISEASELEESMAGAEVVMEAWKEWGLQALVLLSLTVQVALLIRVRNIGRN
jgi:hypothetical protein